MSPSTLTPIGKTVYLLLRAYELCPEIKYPGDGREIIRHTIIHLVDPMWERRWPSAVRED